MRETVCETVCGTVCGTACGTQRRACACGDGRFTVYDVETPEEVREEDCLGWVDINFLDLLNRPDTDLPYRIVNVSDQVRNERLEEAESTVFLRYETETNKAESNGADSPTSQGICVGWVWSGVLHARR